MLRSGGSLDGVALNTTDLVTFVTLTLVTSSGWNGDLYAYLEHKGAITVLVNRAGLTAGNSAGAVSNGMNVTFSDAASVDVHTGLSNTFGSLARSPRATRPCSSRMSPAAKRRPWTVGACR